MVAAGVYSGTSAESRRRGHVLRQQALAQSNTPRTFSPASHSAQDRTDFCNPHRPAGEADCTPRASTHSAQVCWCRIEICNQVKARAPSPDDISRGQFCWGRDRYVRGFRERVCHFRNVCMTSVSPALIMFVDPNNPDSEAEMLKTEAEDALNSRFIRLPTNRDNSQTATTLQVFRDGIPDTAVLHNGSYAYFEPFGESFFGHVIFDALFGAFMAFDSLGLDAEAGTMRLILSRQCLSVGCRKYFWEWARGISESTVERPLLSPAGSMNCFENLVAGVGVFASASGLFPGRSHGFASTFRAFHRTFLRGLCITERDMPSPRQHRVLINPKRGGKRMVVNLEEVGAAIEEELGIGVDFTPPDVFDLSARAQVMLLMDYTVVLTPVGTVSYTLFFARPGTSVVFISHVVWEDVVWNQVEHINDLVYVATEEEVLKHGQLDIAQQWSAADVRVDVPSLLVFVLRAARQQERAAEMRSR